MKFKFSLEGVLRHRQALLTSAQRDLSQAEAIYNQQVDLLNDLIAQKSTAFQRAHDLQRSGGNQAQSLVQVGDFISGQGFRIEKQRKLITELAKKVEEMREILRQKAIDCKILEVAKEKAHEEFRKLERKRDQKLTDEMNSVRAARRNLD